MFFKKKRMDDQNTPTTEQVEETPAVEESVETPVETPSEQPEVSEPVEEMIEPTSEESVEIPTQEAPKNPEINCPACNGEGLNAEQTARCTNCGGTGKV